MAKNQYVKIMPAKIYKCIIGKSLAMIGNQYFANRYQYMIILVACAIWFCKWGVYNKSNSKTEFF